jgi:dienelactone hydrolase
MANCKYWWAAMIAVIAGCGIAAAQQRKAPYETAHDRPLEAKEQVVAEVPEYVQYRVEFNGLKARVPAFMYIPKDGPAKKPAVLLQYGSGGSKKTNYIVAIAQRAVKKGFVVLTIDVPNRGERRQKNVFRLPFEGSFFETLGDYSRAVDYLQTRRDVDQDKLAYVGISWGAITGVTYVAHDPRIKVMASLVGGGDFLGWLPAATIVKAMVDQFDPVHHVGLIAPRPLLLLNVTKDQLVPRFLGESLQKAAGEGAKKMGVETDHFFSTVDRVKMADEVMEFVQESLPK